MIAQYQHQRARPAWPFFVGIVALFAGLAALTAYNLVTIEPNYDRLRLEGCLEYCRSHGDHETPRHYLDCADGCEEALRAK